MEASARRSARRWILAEIEGQTGDSVTALDLPPEDDSLHREQIDVLKQIISDLHDGGDLDGR